MPPLWLTEAELRAIYGDARVNTLADRDNDGQPDDGLVEGWILDAEASVRSGLNKFTDSQLPAETADASRALKLAVAGHALFNAYRHFDAVPASVTAEHIAAREMVKSMNLGTAAVVLEGEPDIDKPAGPIASARAASLSDQPITMASMESWGRR